MNTEGSGEKVGYPIWGTIWGTIWGSVWGSIWGTNIFRCYDFFDWQVSTMILVHYKSEILIHQRFFTVSNVLSNILTLQWFQKAVTSPTTSRYLGNSPTTCGKIKRIHFGVNHIRGHPSRTSGENRDF